MKKYLKLLIIGCCSALLAFGAAGCFASTAAKQKVKSQVGVSNGKPGPSKPGPSKPGPKKPGPKKPGSE